MVESSLFWMNISGIRSKYLPLLITSTLFDFDIFKFNVYPQKFSIDIACLISGTSSFWSMSWIYIPHPVFTWCDFKKFWPSIGHQNWSKLKTRWDERDTRKIIETKEKFKRKKTDSSLKRCNLTDPGMRLRKLQLKSLRLRLRFLLRSKKKTQRPNSKLQSSNFVFI